MIKNITMNYKVKGVPFMNYALCIKNVTLDKQQSVSLFYSTL